MNVILKKILKYLLPNIILRFVTSFFYGWKGNYSNWEKAEESSSGYQSENILRRVKESALKMKKGIAVYERDSVLFNEVQYSYPLLSALMWIAAQNKGELRVLDFGGSLGSSYFQNKIFLDSLPYVKWNIVEQEMFVKEGLKNFADEKLHFYFSIDECLKDGKINVVLLSSVLQYIEKPYDLLTKVKSIKVKYIIVDRTPFIQKKDRITIQKVHPAIYKATYPCWFFNELRFTNFIKKDYNLVVEFDSLDRANINSKFKGFLFEIIAKK